MNIFFENTLRFQFSFSLETHLYLGTSQSHVTSIPMTNIWLRINLSLLFDQQTAIPLIQLTK